MALTAGALGLAWRTVTSSGAGLASRAQLASPVVVVAKGSADVPRASAPRPAAEAGAALPLDEAQRQFLWQVEHHGLVLSKFGFKPIAQALINDDAEALKALLAPGFKGLVPGEPRVRGLKTEFADVSREQDAGGPPRELSADAFVSRLLGYRKPFGKRPGAKLALMTLSPVDRDDLNGPWEGTCQLRIWGQTGPAQPGEVIAYLKYRVARPTEAALKAGRWLTRCTITQAQAGRATHFLLNEVAAERGIEPGRFHDNWKNGQSLHNTGGAYVCDFDRDGRLDLLVTDIKGHALYRGLAEGKFADATDLLPKADSAADEIESPSILAAFADLDGDGWDDLILGERLYRNAEGKRFEDVTYRSFLNLKGEATGLAIADYDRDGRLDLYVTYSSGPGSNSWLDVRGTNMVRNRLWRNKGGWRFEDVTAASHAAGGNRSTFSAVWFDADNDNWPDLYVISEFGNGVLLVNQGDGTFREHDLVKEPTDFGSMGLTCGDIDNDGRIDLYIANMYSKAGNRVIGNLRSGSYPDEIMAKMRRFSTGSQLWHNKGGLTFQPEGPQDQVADVGWAYGPALVDLDNDGWLDIYATCGFISQSRDDPDG